MPNATRDGRAACVLPLLLLLSALLALVLAPSAARGQTAQASSYSAAAPGSTSSVNSNAVASEPGANAVVVASGVAPSGGERVVVDCKLAAANADEQLAKYCKGVPVPQRSSPSATGSNNIVSNNNNSSIGNGNKNISNANDDEGTRLWRAAPICGKDAARGAKVVALDSAGRAWAREPDEPGGKLCAFRDEISGDVAGTANARSGEDSWEMAPDCDGDEEKDFLTRDRAGKAWGWRGGESCAWRNVKPLDQGGGDGSV